MIQSTFFLLITVTIGAIIPYAHAEVKFACPDSGCGKGSHSTCDINNNCPDSDSGKHNKDKPTHTHKIAPQMDNAIGNDAETQDSNDPNSTGTQLLNHFVPPSQIQLDQDYIDCITDPACKPHVLEHFNQTNVPDCDTTDMVGVCWDHVRGQIRE